jgi:hypothetical protein
MGIALTDYAVMTVGKTNRKSKHSRKKQKQGRSWVNQPGGGLRVPITAVNCESLVIYPSLY